MNTILDICAKIERLNPVHAKKLNANLKKYDDLYFTRANEFLSKYLAFLANQNRTIDFAIDCYLRMLADVAVETINFRETGKYTSSTFAEVNKRVYGDPSVMEYYMHGLLLSQFLWRHHYQILNYFISTLPQYRNGAKKYLEIGAGHGLYLYTALTIFDKKTLFDVVDISPTSIELAKQFVENERVHFVLQDIFESGNSVHYDFITMGEVLEHMEDPVKLLKRVRELLSPDGTAFITTPTNAPAIDHIHLFRNAEDIRSAVSQAGLRITSESSFYAEDVSEEVAEELKITLMYGAFLKRK
jgi:2-polyprenyl-3-methyl-5-hydroxy-6-metoxy-1,4-benzoquinol methylase